MAYTATVTLDFPRCQIIGRGLGLISGIADINPYHTTGAEITAITGKFRSLLRCIVDGFSDNGYLVRWNTTDKCFHAYYPTTIISTSGTVNDALGYGTGANAFITANGAHTGVSAGSECANDLDVGVVNFIAIGRI